MGSCSMDENYTMMDSSSSESEVEEVFEQYKLEGGIQASEGEGQGDLDMDSFVVGLNPKAQKVVRELLSKRKIVKEGNIPRVKGGAVSAAFQDPVGGSKKAKINFNSDRNSDDVALGTAVASNSRKRPTSRKNTGSHGSESKKWTHDEIIKLIDLYEENSHLWDVFDRDYHNRDKRERTLNDISLVLKTDVADIKTKLLSLRSQLGRERVKISKTKSGQCLEDLYKPTWIYWDKLQFLQAVMQPGKSRDNILSQDVGQKNPLVESLDLEASTNSACRRRNSSATPKVTKKSLDNRKHELLSTCINVLKQPELKPSESSSHFALYITEKLSGFNARDRCIAEKKISDVIFDIALKNLQLTSQQTHAHDNQESNCSCSKIDGCTPGSNLQESNDASFMDSIS